MRREWMTEWRDSLGESWNTKPMMENRLRLHHAVSDNGAKIVENMRLPRYGAHFRHKRRG